jgi:hypothetical protein
MTLWPWEKSALKAREQKNSSISAASRFEKCTFRTWNDLE